MKDQAMKGIKVVYYYETSPCVGNVATICLFISEEGYKLISRGIAICSLSDQFSKEEGRKRAYKFARMAFGSRETKELINKSNANANDYYSYVIRRKKVKNEEEAENFILSTKGLIYEYRIIKSGDKKYVQYKLPYYHPLYMISLNFTAKSYYKPKPTDREIDEFRVASA